MAEPLSLDARRAILDKEVDRYVKRGFRVVSRTDTTAQLVKPKSFSCLWALLGILIIYLLWYMAKKDEQVYLTVDEAGKIHKR